MPVSEDDLVGARRLVDWFETDSEIEGGAFGCRRPQSHSLERGSGVVHQGQHKGTTHPDASHIGSDIHVSDSGHLNVVEVWITIQSPDCDETGSDPRLEDRLTGLVEAIGAVVPLVDETPDEVVPFGLAGIEKPIDVVGKRMEGLDHEVCDHDQASYGRHQSRGRR